MSHGIHPKGKHGLVVWGADGAGRPCHYCEREMRPFSITHPTKDHVVPASRGGKSTVLACYQCNQMKGNLMPMEWADFMLANPRWWESKTIKPPKSAVASGPCPVMVACANDLARERYKHLGVYR